MGAIVDVVVTQLIKSCSCPLSAKFIAEAELMCGDRTTDRVIIQAKLVSLEDTSSEELHTQLQAWVDTEPAVEITGNPLQILSCSTYPGDGVSCEIAAPSSTVSINIVDAKGQDTSSSPIGIPVYGGLIGALIVIIVIIVVVILVVAVARRRMKRRSLNISGLVHSLTKVGGVKDGFHHTIVS